MIEEFSRGIQEKAHASSLESGETLLEISRAKDNPMLDETPVLEEIPIHQLENEKGLECEYESDEEIETVWEDEEPSGKTLNSTLDNTCAQSCDEIACDSCDDNDNESSYFHGIFDDVCGNFDCGDEEMVSGSVEGAIRFSEVVIFDNNFEGELFEKKEGIEEVFTQLSALNYIIFEGEGEKKMSYELQNLFERLSTISKVVLGLISRMIVLEFEGARHLWAYLNSKADGTHGEVPISICFVG
nr:hypothetical protein Iba_chr12dCG8990 [Ipomoea batatas]